MKKYFLIALLLYICSCKNSLVKESGNHPFDQKSTITKKQSELIFSKVKALPNQTQVSIAIIDNNKVTFHGVKRENDSTKIISNYRSNFEIGSVSKVFTGTLLSNFVIDKKIEFNNNINDYLEFSLKENVLITFKQLATHTSGLPRIPASLDSVSLENPYKDFGEEELKTYLTEHLEMSQNPGAACDYSNLGVGLLGYVLSKIEETTYEDLLQTSIFSKYKMNNSTSNRNKIMDRLVLGVNEQGEEVPNWDMSILEGAGGILSTTEDLSKFAIAQFDSLNKELELTRRVFFKVDDKFSMGLCWSIISTDSGAEWNWHNGGTGGYTSSMIIDTESKNGVIVLSNISALGEMSKTITSLGTELMNTLN